MNLSTNCIKINRYSSTDTKYKVSSLQSSHLLCSNVVVYQTWLVTYVMVSNLRPPKNCFIYLNSSVTPKIGISAIVTAPRQHASRLPC